jgi:hypothetical protein
MKENHTTLIHQATVTPGGFKLKAAAQYLGGMSPVTVRRLVARGLLRPNRATRHLLFARAELDRFLAS